MLKLGAGYIKPFAGFQYYTVDTDLAPAHNVTDDLDVWSYVLGVSTSWNIGAFSLGGQLSYGMNQGAVTGWATGSNAARRQLALPGWRRRHCRRLHPPGYDRPGPEVHGHPAV